MADSWWDQIVNALPNLEGQPTPGGGSVPPASGGILRWPFATPGATSASAAPSYTSGASEGTGAPGSGGSSTPGAPKSQADQDKDAIEALTRRQLEAEASLREAQARAADAQNNPARTAAEIAKANADVEVSKLRLQQIQQEMSGYESPGAKRQADLEARLAADEAEARRRREEQASSQGFTSSENEKARAATASENSARRAFEDQQQQQRLQAAREEADAQAKLTLRSQAIDAAKAQDAWVMDTIKNQIAAGQLSLGKATSMWDAYLAKAKLPTQILDSVSNAITPLVPYMTSRNAGDSMPGFESGGPMEQLVNRGGGSYDPSTYAVKPVTMSLYDMAKQAGANWADSGKTPSVSSVFSKVPDIKVNPGSSAIGNVPNIGAIQSILPQVPPDVKPTADESAKMAAALGAK